MSDKSDQMRPIPDGGLKEAMPSWLKRPPAWRELPSVEERHERNLPEPDTSVIDPHSLVGVTDLPLWLQSISARGVIPAPEADILSAPEVTAVEEDSTIETETETSDTANDAVVQAPSSDLVPEEPVATSLSESAPASPTELAKTGMPSWLMPIAIVAFLAVVIALYFVL